MEYYLEFILITILSLIQFLIGIGVLVLGTPIFLLMDYSIITTMSKLLPISIMTSAISIFINFKDFQIINFIKKKNKFFYFCIPSVLIGIIILKIISNIELIKYFVSFVILLSLILKNLKKKYLDFLIKNTEGFLLIFTGIIHGITNSGGSLIALMALSKHKKKRDIRNEIILLYLFLASIQFIFLIYFFEFSYNLEVCIINLLLVFFAALAGTKIDYYLQKEKLEKVLSAFILLSAVFLLVKP